MEDLIQFIKRDTQKKKRGRPRKKAAVGGRAVPPDESPDDRDRPELIPLTPPPAPPLPPPPPRLFPDLPLATEPNAAINAFTTFAPPPPQRQTPEERRLAVERLREQRIQERQARLNGTGWVGDQVKKVKKAAQKAARKVGSVVLGKKTAEKIERYGDAVLFLSNLPLPPSVKEYLRKYGDELISKIVIVRNPVQKLLTGAMDVASLGSFGKKMGRLPYDDLFHLQLWVTTPSGVFGMEKNEVITFTHNPTPKQNAEFQEVSVKPDLTMNKLMMGSEKIQGDKWTRYNASNNNCQDFVMSLLNGSGLGNESNFKFVKQDTDSLFKDDSFLRKLSRNLTNIGASVSTAISGVDDKPVASTNTSDTFEIPSPVDTDVLEAGGMYGGVEPIEPRIELDVSQFVDAVRRGDPAVISDWNRIFPSDVLRAYLLRLPNELLIQVLQYYDPRFLKKGFDFRTGSPTQFRKRKDDPDDDDMGAPPKRRATSSRSLSFGTPLFPDAAGAGMVKRGRGRPRKMTGV